MRTRAFGRIVSWQGASLWILTTRPGEVYPKTSFHAHHAVQVTIALRGTLGFQTEVGAYAGCAAAVAPDLSHAFQADGAVAHLFVEPESRLGRALAARVFQRGPLAALDATSFEETRARLCAWYERPDRTDADLIELGRALLSEVAEAPGNDGSDPRVERILAWAPGQLRNPVSLVDAARLVGLSPGRARHLFVEQTGLPFRTWLLWLRLQKAIEGYAQGKSLTDAALEAGFSDSAHLSRTFRSMFGITADSLAINTDRTRVPLPEVAGAAPT
jgi:AraC family transcriptional regulator